MKTLIASALLCLLLLSSAAAEKPPLLLRQPSLSASSVVFTYGGDLWLVDRSGGQARRLTAGAGLEYRPSFSPDGKQVAFTGEHDSGNFDVYVVAATGGSPRRLTWHPGVDEVVGWSPDSRQVLFRSLRASSARYPRLFTVPLTGGMPLVLPLPMGVQGSFSADGKQLAYVPLWNRRTNPYVHIAWKRYRGGRAAPIWIARLADSSVSKIPRTDSNDHDPMWIGDRIYFLSDRDGPVTLYAYQPGQAAPQRLIDAPGPDISSAAAGPGAIVYERFGALYLYHLASGKSRAISVALSGDLAGLRPRVEEVSDLIAASGFSPSGARAVFEARGEIWTVPAEKGQVRNLTRSPAVADRSPAWSPDGKWVACLSDESGEYALHLQPQDGIGPVKKFSLGRPPSFFYQPLWSPDSRQIALTDKRLQLWLLDVESGRKRLVDRAPYERVHHGMDPSWSPDSRWLSYIKQDDNHLGAVWVFSVDSGKNHRLSDGMSDASGARFTADGKALVFLASTDSGGSVHWLDMSSMSRPVSRSVWLMVLSAQDPSPLKPQSDEERGRGEDPPAAEAKKEKKPTPPRVRIDFADIDQRTLALPVPARDYRKIVAGKKGALYLLWRKPGPGPDRGRLSVEKFSFEKRKAESFLAEVSSFVLSADSQKVLFRKDRAWFIQGTDKPPPAGKGKLKLAGMSMQIDPRAEWTQIYNEVWRIQRDFLYDPKAHGLDLRAAAEHYRPYLAGLAHRAELNALLTEMLGHLVLGHTVVSGGDVSSGSPTKVGLLGADYESSHGRFRFARVYNGENWNPELKAPLTQPGARVRAGEYLLAIDELALSARDNIHARLDGKAGRTVRLKVGPRPDGKKARTVEVLPVGSEAGLRHRAWVEDRRRLVNRLSGDRVGYVYLPNTAGSGYSSFNRYYFAQTGKQAMVMDERFNRGGLAADYIVDYLRRPLLNYWSTREGKDFTTPGGSVFGPRVMIINELSGSGGDALPWYFRKLGLGKLIGKRTWGGLVGIYDYPRLLDGGNVTAPRIAFWNPQGSWEVENHGVAPDIEVDFDPKSWRAGRDPQLEKAVEVLLQQLKKNPPPVHHRPSYPNYHRQQPF